MAIINLEIDGKPVQVLRVAFDANGRAVAFGNSVR